MDNIIEELKWRGLVHDIKPGTEEQLLKEPTAVYIGFDPTSDSLHIGSLVPIILLKHLRNFGHQPIALVGGATGMIGDPSGKSKERNLLDEQALSINVEGIKQVLSKFLDFDAKDDQKPILVNNYDWMKSFSFIDFVREVGKRITVNYMMAKDSVKKRLSADQSEGMSFTEFTYQLIQGYDFYYLHKNYHCLAQMGGSDQWGNITTGTELIRRMNSEQTEAFAMTCPLITKSDGSKFGKSESGNVWLTEDKTSAYKFYQFWLKTTDQDAEKYLKIFTFLDKQTIESIIAEHQDAPHQNLIQKKLAKELTLFVHGQSKYEQALKASAILFGKSSADDIKSLNEQDFLEVFEGVSQSTFSKSELTTIGLLDFLSKTGFMPSNSEARRQLKQNAISINKEKIKDSYKVSEIELINDKFILLQKGKKDYFIVICE